MHSFIYKFMYINTFVLYIHTYILKPHSHIHDLSHDLADVVHTTKIYVLSTILCKFCLFFEVEDSYSITIGYP